MEAAALMDPQIDLGFRSSSSADAGAALPCSKQILANGYELGSNGSSNSPVASGISVDVGKYVIGQAHADSDSPPFWNSGAGTGSGSGSSSPDEDGDEPEHEWNATLKFISDILMEEDWDGKKCMFQDCMGLLQAAEKSFSDALNGRDQPAQAAGEFGPGLIAEKPVSEPLEGSFGAPGLESSVSSNGTYSQPEVSFSEIFEQERWRFDGISAGSTEFHQFQYPGDGGAGAEMARRQRDRDEEDYDEEGRRSKYSATSPEESSPAVEDEQVDDRFLLCDKNGECNAVEPLKPLPSGKNVTKRSRNKKGEKKPPVVDLREVLSHCAQAVASYDVRTANELLAKIRLQSSPYGDANQRLAHYLADSLEARLVGSSTHLFSLVRLRAPAVDILKAYKLHVSSCPFKKISNLYANRLIDKLALKATSLHIIDFGILYGFQWPCLIQRLSQRPGGPPRLRITGIELPQPGFRPSERVEETGDRLAKYCRKFNVPFEYTAIAQKWETIIIEDLNLGDHDIVVVNCMYRLRNLPDETVSVSNPRDTVLELIRKINPNIFVQAAVNGTYNAPFFLTRFRETMFHFSALYDIFEATVPSENQERLLYEKEVLGRDAMNIIACEGSQRIDRPETYRRWQARIRRAGFEQLALDQELMKLVRSKVRQEYHKDFVVDEDKEWLLQGWKGRILYALTVWIPTSED